MKPSCYNRPPFKDSVTVQDGWFPYFTNQLETRMPRMITLPDNMSKGCKQHGPLGEATLHPDDWDCVGCEWKPEETK